MWRVFRLMASDGKRPERKHGGNKFTFFVSAFCPNSWKRKEKYRGRATRLKRTLMKGGGEGVGGVEGLGSRVLVVRGREGKRGALVL